MGSAKEFKQVGDISGAVLLLYSHPMKSWDDLFGEYLTLPTVVERAFAGKAI